MNAFEETGGVRIGGFKATWPFATLKVSEFKFELNASIKGDFVFKHSDIISMIPHTSILGSSIQIIHRVEKYNKEILFTFLGNAEERMTEIEHTGFLNHIAPSPSYIDLEIDQLQQQSGFPIKIPVAVGILSSGIYCSYPTFQCISHQKGNRNIRDWRGDGTGLRIYNIIAHIRCSEAAGIKEWQ